MKNLITAFVLMIAISVTLSARETYKPVQDIDVGYAPIHLLYESQMDRFHLFCLGLDEDNDGVYDPDDGDEKPSWWILTEKDGGFDAELEREFEFKSLHPMAKPVLDSGDIYVALNHEIKNYFWEQQQYWEREVIENISFTSMAVHGNDLVLSMAEPDTAGAQLIFVTKTSGNKHRYVKIGDTIVKIDKATLSDGSEKFVLLSDIPGEQVNLKLFIADIQTPTIEPDSLVLSETVNRLTVQDSMVYISEFGDNSNITAVNANNISTQKYYLGTGANVLKPVYHNNALYISTDKEEIRKIDLMTGNLNDIIEDDAISLEPAFDDNYMIVPNMVQNEDEPGNEVTIYRKVDVNMQNLRVDLQVGSQPHAVFRESGNSLHVICGGIDVDFDGEYDPGDGDEKASWWNIQHPIPASSGFMKENGFFVDKKGDLPFRSVSYSYGGKILGGKLYHPNGDNITVYNYDGTELNNIEIGENVRIFENFDNKYIIGQRNSEVDDYVFIRSQSNETIFDTLKCGTNIVDIATTEYFSGKKNIFILDEGDFSKPNSSKLFIYEYEVLGHYEIDTLMVGDDCVDIEFAKGKIYVTSNGSNKITVIEKNNGSYKLSDHYTGTHGWNGPRSITYDDSKELFYVPTYAGDVRVMDTEGNIIKLHHTPGKAEHTNYIEQGLSDFDSSMIAAAVPLTASYAPQDTISIFNYKMPNSVIEETNKSLSKIKLYPNPATNQTNLELSGDIKHGINFKIYDLKGTLIRAFDGNSAQSTYSFSLSGLSNGYYVLRIINGSEISTIPLQIQK